MTKSSSQYNFFINNCIHWSTRAIDYGIKFGVSVVLIKKGNKYE